MYSRIATAALSILLAAAVSPAYAGTTHLMQPTADSHVMLLNRYFDGGTPWCNSAGFKDQAFFRVFPDGTLSPEPFAVPKEQYLVITDVEWSAVGGQANLFPGYTFRMTIGLATASSSFPVFQSRGLTLDADSATGRPGSSEQLTAGFVVGLGVSICPNVTQTQPSAVIVGLLDRVILRGYLVPMK